jgi:hypothetical protein
MIKGKPIKLTDPRITIFASEEGVKIEVHDNTALIQFLEITMSPEKFLAALGRQGHVKCESATIMGLDRIGKKHENKTVEIPLPDEIKVPDKQRKEKAFKAAKAYVAEYFPGWIPDNHFSSQGSFFKKGEEWWARVTIRRWIEIE